MVTSNSKSGSARTSLSEQVTEPALRAFAGVAEYADEISQSGGAKLLGKVGFLLGTVSFAARYLLPFFEDWAHIPNARMSEEEFFTMVYLAAFMIFAAAGIRVWIFAKTIESSTEAGRPPPSDAEGDTSSDGEKSGKEVLVADESSTVT